jgi:acylphosphatase
MPSHRLRILYAGRVQGVGFRATTARLAQRHRVTGYVRNLPDGRVELVVEGEPAAVDQLLAAVAERMRGHIDGADRSASPATGEFDAFDVRG